MKEETMNTHTTHNRSPRNQYWGHIILAGLLTYSLGCSTGCSTTHKVDATKTPSQDPSNAATNNEIGVHNQASWYTELQFKKNDYKLDRADKTALDDLVEKSQRSGTVEHIKVISWADQAYPANRKNKLSSEQVDLASKRNDQIKEYFEAKYPSLDVDVYNMAKRPNALQELFDTSDATTKKSISDSGALVANNEPARSSTKESSALVLSVLK
jgi:hypothetical protein